MNCEHTNKLMQEWLDGSLAGQPLAKFQQHLQGCANCAAKAQEWQALQAGLRNLPAPAVPADLNRRLGLVPAVRKTHKALPMALAASLLLALVGLPWMLSQDDSVSRGYDASETVTAQVQLPLHASETLQLVVSSASDLKQIQLTLELPPHLELKGFPKQHIVSWKTDFLAGNNRLSLPLTAKRAGSGELIARIQIAGKSKELRVRINTPQEPPRQGRRDSKTLFTLATLQTIRSNYYA